MFERGVERRWRSTISITWEAGRKGSGDFITIEKGREFENSVPFLFWWFIPRDDPKFLFAALIHDYMLESGKYGRTQAAAEWFDACLKVKVSKLKAKIAFVGVAAWAVFKPKYY